MKNNSIRRLGGAAAVVALISSSVFLSVQQAVADEVTSPGLVEVVIIEGPHITGPPSEPVPNPLERPSQSPTVPVVEAQPSGSHTISESPQSQGVSTVSPEAIASTESSSTPVEERAVSSDKPLALTRSPIAVTAPLPAGTKVITPAAKAALFKVADVVNLSGRSAVISVKTAGTTVAKATVQANALVVELKKRGVAAVTVIKRVGNKTSVSVLVTKKP